MRGGDGKGVVRWTEIPVTVLCVLGSLLKQE